MYDLEDILLRIERVIGPFFNFDTGQPDDIDVDSNPFQLRASITTDIKATESYYLDKYGIGDTMYVRLKDYEHGKKLAEQLFWKLKGFHADMSTHTGESFNANDKLYLFIHIKNEHGL